MRLSSSAHIRPNTKMSIPAPAFSTLRRTAALSATIFVALGVLLSATTQITAQNLHSPRTQPLQPQASQLPPTPPTTLPQQPAATGSGTANQGTATTANCQTPPCAASSPDGAPKPTRPHRAAVTFENGQLTVAANDSSLHQILRSISNQTGMTITGGVEEQRVFGTYGPSDPASILATLLDGTGVNLLLKDGPNHIPAALVLTQRSGGPTPAPITPDDEKIAADELPVAVAPPPTPRPAPVVLSAPASQAAQPHTPQPGQSQQLVATPARSTPPSVPPPANNVLGSPDNVTPTASQIPTTNSVPLDALPTPSTTVQTQQGIVDTPNPPNQGAPTSTPDSIYQQLLQLQKAKDAAAAKPTQTPATTPPTATPPQ